MILSDVKYTKAGLLVREDAHLGFIVFSTHTGLVFACQAADGEALLKWLDRKSSEAPSPEYKKALGPGWAISLRDADYPSKHLLPSAGAGWSILHPDYPIVINWLLTVYRTRYPGHKIKLKRLPSVDAHCMPAAGF
jgi:hypothetical protein